MKCEMQEGECHSHGPEFAERMKGNWMAREDLMKGPKD